MREFKGQSDKMDEFNGMIPEVATDYEHNGLNVYVSCEALQKQTDDLRECVEALINLHVKQGNMTSSECTDAWYYGVRETIEKATGMKWDEVRELVRP